MHLAYSIAKARGNGVAAPQSITQGNEARHTTTPRRGRAFLISAKDFA
jgi:hypothetical protein